MYFENGSYKNSNAYKNAMESQKANHSSTPLGYEPNVGDSTPPITSIKADNDIIAQIQSKLQEVNKRLEIQSTQKGKSYYTQQKAQLEKELQELEIKAGIRSEASLNPNVKTREIQSQGSIKEVKERIKNKTTNKQFKIIKAENYKDLPIATKDELDSFLTKAFSGDTEALKTLPNVIKVGKINKYLSEKLNLKSDDVFFTKKTATHARESRKQSYNQAVRKMKPLRYKRH